MRIAIIGATGHVGTTLLEVLERDTRVDEIVGIARRSCALVRRRTRFIQADIARDDLDDALRGMDAVVHLAWQIQPAHNFDRLERTNIEGSKRVFTAAAHAGVKTLVYASSVGVYSKGTKERFVDESWPRAGIQSSTYGRHKAQVEALLDAFESGHPHMRIVRLRPALTFRREAASGVKRLFFGPLVPRFAFRRGFLPGIPDLERLKFQAVHSLDVARAYQLALFNEVAHGAYNIAAEPVIDARRLAAILEARRLKVSEQALRRAAAAGFRLHLVRADPGWLDLAFELPLVDAARARHELDWSPRYSATEAVSELAEGLREGAALPTPPLGRGPYGRFSTGLAR